MSCRVIGCRSPYPHHHHVVAGYVLSKVCHCEANVEIRTREENPT